MTGITPLYGIHHPTSATKHVNLGPELKQMADDVERALAAATIPPATPAPVIVAPSAAARDQHWGVPGNEAARLTLQGRGATTIRTDTGDTERYYATFNALTNPQGATVAGWYSDAAGVPVPGLVLGDIYKLPELYAPLELRRFGRRMRLAGSVTINQRAEFAANATYVVAVVPDPFRPPYGNRQPLSPAVASPMSTAWTLVGTNGHVPFSLSTGTTQNADGWVLSIDTEWLLA